MESQIAQPISKTRFWIGWTISALPILLMAGMSTFMLIFKLSFIEEGMSKMGYPPHLARTICIVEIACAVLYAIPQTAVLGAILLTGYLGGATATHVRIGEPFYFPILVGILVWLGLLLRDKRIQDLLPVRRMRSSRADDETRI